MRPPWTRPGSRGVPITARQVGLQSWLMQRHYWHATGEGRIEGMGGRGEEFPGEAGQPVRCGGAGLLLTGAVLLLFGPPRRSRLLSKPQHTSHTSTPHLRSMGENAVASQLPGGGGAVPGGSTGGTSGRRLLLSGPSGVAVEMGPPHVIVELAFTSSVRFLQPGLLLQVRGGGAE